MAKIKVYRGIGADTKEELEKYIKDFYDKNIKAQGYGGGGNLGNGIYFTTDKNEAIAYSKANDYKEWKYSHVFEVEIDTDDFLPTDKIDDAKMLELDSEYKRLDAIMKSGYFNDDTYSEWIKAQDRALDKYVKLQNKKGVMSDNIFNIQNKDAIFDVPTVKDVVKSSNYWDKRAIKRLNEAEKTSDAYIERIKKIYDQAYKDVEGEIARVYKNYSKETGLDVQKLKELLTRSETKKTWEQMKRQGLDKYIKDNYKSRISRLEQIQAQIYAKAKQIYPKEELEQTMCYKGVINNSYYKAVYDTQMGTGYDFSFNKIDNNLLNSILNEKWSGANYSQRIWGNTDILADSLSQVLGGALLSGQSIEKTTKQIKDRFNVSKYYAERLVRTETNHFNNEADAMAYEEMGIDKYVFVATLDSRTSETCQNHDGKVYEYKDKEVGVNFPPLHPNCRSKTRGYLGEEAEKTLKRRARNPITGKTEVIDNISYENWIKQYVNNAPVEPKTTKINKKVAKNSEKYNKIDDIFGGGVKLTGIDTSYQKEINEEFIKIANKYPIDLSTTQLKTNTATRQIGHSWNCIKATWDRRKGNYKVSLRDELVLNKAKYCDKDTSIATHKRANEYYKKPYNGDLSTLWHEYGHQIDDKYCMALNPKMAEIKKGLTYSGINMSRDVAKANFNDYKEYNNLLRRDNMSKRVWEQLYNVMKEKNNGQYNYSSYYADIREFLGSYATENNQEFLAEGFTAMNIIPKEEQSDFVKEFAKIFDAEFDKVLRR